jgi:hypothetical protein
MAALEEAMMVKSLPLMPRRTSILAVGREEWLLGRCWGKRELQTQSKGLISQSKLESEAAGGFFNPLNDEATSTWALNSDFREMIAVGCWNAVENRDAEAPLP